MSDDKLHYRANQFLKQGVTWSALNAYLQSEQNLNALEASVVHSIFQTTELNELRNIQSIYKDSISGNILYTQWSSQLANLIQSKQASSLFIPSFHWHGLDNAYHLWISKIIKGNWGDSSIDRRPAWIKIKEALSWTLTLNLFALFFIYILAVMIGEILFLYSHKRITRWLENGLLFFL
jgi:ABC-type dipeptide/oligopeptide/nickel transport system permease component